MTKLSTKFAHVSKRAVALVSSLAIAVTGLVAGVAAPASASVPEARQLTTGASFGLTLNSPNMAISGGYAYVLSQQGYGSDYASYTLFRKAVANISSAPTVIADGTNATACGATGSNTLGASVTGIAEASEMTVAGNNLYLLECAGSPSNIRVVKFDISNTSATSVSGTVVANHTSLSDRRNSHIVVDANLNLYNLSSNYVFKIAVDGSGYYSAATTTPLASLPNSASIYRGRMDSQGSLVLMSQVQASPLTIAGTFTSVNTSTGALTTLKDVPGTSLLYPYEFSMDPATDDILYLDNQNAPSKVRRIVKGTNSDYATIVDAVKPAMKIVQISHQAFVANSNNQLISITTSADAPVALGDSVSDTLSTGSATFYSGVVTEITDARNFKVKLNNSVYGTLASDNTESLAIYKKFNSIQAIAASSDGIFTLDTHANIVSGANTNQTFFMGSEAASPLFTIPAQFVTVRAFHRGLTASWSAPASIPDVTAMEAQLWVGSTQADALTAAATGTNPALTCASTESMSARSYSCPIYSGVEVGKYYAIRVKLSTATTSQLSANPVAPSGNSSSNANVVQAVDSAMSASLASDVPTGTGPGYAHVGTSTGSALTLIRNAAPRESASDGVGGKYFAISTGNNNLAEYKLIHVKGDGSVDSTFGTAGVQTVANQFSTGTRTIKLGWFGDTKWFMLDSSYTNTGTNYRLTYQTGATTTSSYTFTDATLRANCAASFTHDNTTNGQWIGSVTTVSAASSAPLLNVPCGVSYQTSQNAARLNNLPILVTVTGDNTTSVFSKPLGDPTMADVIAPNSTFCLSAAGANPANPTVSSGGTLVTLMYNGYTATNNQGCMGGNNSAGIAFQIATDGTATRVVTGAPQVSYSEAFPAGNGVFYLVSQNNNGMTPTITVSRLLANGTIDSTFGSAGSMNVSGPSCTGSPTQIWGIVAGSQGRKYLAFLSIKSAPYSPQNPNPATSAIPAAMLIDAGQSADRVGSSMMGIETSLAKYSSSVFGSGASGGGSIFATSGMDANTGAMSFAFFKNDTDGLGRITWDSFATALPAGDDAIECPALPFVASTNSMSGSYSRGFRTVKLTNGKFFLFGNSGMSQVTANKSEILDLGSNPVDGTFSWTSAIPTTGGLNGLPSGASLAALPDNKVLIAGGTYYDSVVTHTSANQLVAAVYDAVTNTYTATGSLSKARCSAVTQSLSNGKVLIFGGDNCSMSSQASYTDAEIFDPTAGTFTAVTGDLGASFSNIVALGGGKHMILGTPLPSNCCGQVQGSSVTKIYDEATNSFSNGPALTSARVAPVVVALPAGKVFVAGGLQTGPGAPGAMPSTMTGEIYTPGAGGAIGTFAAITANSPSAMVGASGVVLPSGKVMILLGSNNMMYGQASTQSIKFNPANNSWAAGDERGTATAGAIPFVVGTKIVMLGESTNMSPSVQSHFTVYSEPAEAQAAITSTAPRVVKATTGSVTYTVPTALNPAAGKTSVVFANASGSTALTATVTWNTASKVVLSNNNLSVTVPLPTAVQAARAGDVTVTIKSGASGTDIIGTTTLTYLATADVPTISSQAATGLNGHASAATASVALAATSLLSPNQPGSGLTYTSATTAVCTVNATGVVTRVARGICTINVKQPKGLGNAEKTQAFTWEFDKTAQSIAYADANPTTLPLTEDGTALTATSTSGLLVDFEATTDDICAVDDAGVLTTLALGTCTITLDQAGDATYLAAPQITETITIANPVTPPVDAPNAPIGDGVFGDVPAGDTMASVNASQRMTLSKNINLGRGWKIQYTPTVKSGNVTTLTLNPTITSNYMGAITTVFSIPKAASKTTPAGWTLPKNGTAYTCTVTYGVTKKLAANARAKTVTYKPAKPCTLAISPKIATGTVITVKNTWDRRNAKTYVAVTGGAQKRTAKITLSAN